MADEVYDEGSTSSHEIGESSESAIEINIKTLDSQVYKFCVKKDMSVQVLKAKIANETGLPVSQQRLIFRGKVLKDDQLLSDYNLEDGHTLHLVARQPVEAQSTPVEGSEDSSRANANQGNDSNNNAPRHRAGQVSHNVVLGTLNFADQGDGLIADIGRVVGAVLQSLRGGMLTSTAGANNPASASAQVHPVGEAEGSRNVNGRPQSGNQAQLPASAVNRPFQIPQLASLGGSSRNMIIPDSLTTLLDFINRMDFILRSIGSQQSSPSNMQDPPRSENPLNMNTFPTPEMLGSVINQARQLLSGNAAAAFSHMAERLQGESNSTDPVVRNQILAEAMHMGLAMQHLGSMLLELGRTTMMLRMGSSPGESFVNAGPAVYISPMGPNPIMVQPFPSQTSSQFMPSFSSLPGGVTGPLGAGDLLRNINIHVVSGTSVAPGASAAGATANTGDGNHNEHQNAEPTNQSGSLLGNSASMRGLPATVVAAVPARTSSESASHVLSVIYPVQVRSQQLVPLHSTSSQGSLPSASSGILSNASVSISLPSSESGNIPAMLTQVNVHGASSVAESVPSQSSSSSMSQPNVAIPIPQTSEIDAISTLVTQINDQITNVLSRNTQSGSLSLPSNQLFSSSAVTEPLSLNSNENSLSSNADGTVHAGNCSENGSLGSHLPDISLEDLNQKQIQKAGIEDPNSADCRGCGLEESTCNSLMEAGNHTYSTLSVDKSLQSSKPSHGLSSQGSESDKATPLGLGISGLQPKRPNKPAKSTEKGGLSRTSPSVSQSQETIARGQQVLQSLVSQESNINIDNVNASSASLPSLISQAVNSISLGGEGARGQIDAGNMMSQVLQSPTFNSLLTNVAQQTGIGPPSDLRSMMEECTQSPAIRNTLNEIVQQVQGQDLGRMLFGSGRGQGGMDFSRMIQQMMPVLSQAIGRVPAHTAPGSAVQSETSAQSNDTTGQNNRSHARNFQINLHGARERIEGHDSPRNIFHAVLEGAAHLFDESSSYEGLIQELGDNLELSNEYMDVLRQHICQRLQEQTRNKDKP